MVKQLEFADMKCVDDSKGTRGIHIACGDKGNSIVSLFFDKSTSHKQTDDLLRLLQSMKITSVIIDTP